MPTGTRGSMPVSPMNRTGQIYREQMREKQARDKAASADVETIKRQARAEGFDAGHDAAIQWVIERMIAAGLDPDVLVANEVEATDG